MCMIRIYIDPFFFKLYYYMYIHNSYHSPKIRSILYLHELNTMLRIAEKRYCAIKNINKHITQCNFSLNIPFM